MPHLTVGLYTWASQEGTLGGGPQRYEAGLGGTPFLWGGPPRMGPTSLSETVHTCTEDQDPLRTSKVKYWQRHLGMLGERRP